MLELTELQHSDVDKSRISIAESNLTTSDSSLSDSSSSPMTSPRNDVIEGGETRDVTPKDPSPVQVHTSVKVSVKIFW